MAGGLVGWYPDLFSRSRFGGFYYSLPKFLAPGVDQAPAHTLYGFLILPYFLRFLDCFGSDRCIDGHIYGI